MSIYQYLLIGGGVAVLLAAILYAVGRGRAFKLPAAAIGIFGGFALGVAVGIGLMAYYEDEEAILGRKRDLSNISEAASANAPATSLAPTAAPAAGKAQRKGGGGGMMGGGGMGGGGGMMGMGGGGGAPRGPSAQAQLAALVNKLDQLSKKPLTVTFDDARKAKVREQLQGLADLKVLSQEEAKKRFDALIELLKDQRETLEAAGYRWPGSPAPGGGGGMLPPPEPDNPFKVQENGAHLDALTKTLGAK